MTCAAEGGGGGRPKRDKRADGGGGAGGGGGGGGVWKGSAFDSLVGSGGRIVGLYVSPYATQHVSKVPELSGCKRKVAGAERVSTATRFNS